MTGTRAIVGVVGEDGSLGVLVASVAAPSECIFRRVVGGVSMLSESISILFSALALDGDSRVGDDDTDASADVWNDEGVVVGVLGLLGVTCSPDGMLN